MCHVTEAMLPSDWLRADAARVHGVAKDCVAVPPAELVSAFLRRSGAPRIPSCHFRAGKEADGAEEFISLSLEPTNCSANVHKAAMNNAAAVSQQRHRRLRLLALFLSLSLPLSFYLSFSLLQQERLYFSQKKSDQRVFGMQILKHGSFALASEAWPSVKQMMK